MLYSWFLRPTWHKTLAEHLDLDGFRELFKKSLNEDIQANKKLAELAVTTDGINMQVCKRKSA